MRPFPGFSFVGTLCPIIVIDGVVSQSTSAEKTYRVAISILAAAGGIALLYYGQVFFITVIIAFMIAFLLEPAVRLLMKIRMPRGLASFLVCALWLACLYFAGLGLYTEGVAMVEDLPAYGARINQLVESAAVRVDAFEQNVYRTLVPKRFQDQDVAPQPPPELPAVRGKKKSAEPPPSVPPVQEVRLRQEPTAMLSYVYDYLHSFYNVLLMASFIPFLVYFILSWGDHLRSRLLFTLEGEPRYTVAKALDGVGDMVRAYVVGNFLLGILLSVASVILFASVSLPYWQVVGPMSGFLSLVPYIGMPLALIPPLVAALPKNEPALYLFLLVSVGLLHLFALNLLYPKFVGSRVHLNPLAVTIALMLWGILWGGIGLLLAIPITAGIKAICDNVSSLKPYGRLLGD
jgi:predicted PurR-regulated permease PerM